MQQIVIVLSHFSVLFPPCEAVSYYFLLSSVSLPLTKVIPAPVAQQVSMALDSLYQGTFGNYGDIFNCYNLDGDATGN